jgi:hypothetical protein
MTESPSLLSPVYAHATLLCHSARIGNPKTSYQGIILVTILRAVSRPSRGEIKNVFQIANIFVYSSALLISLACHFFKSFG